MGDIISLLSSETDNIVAPLVRGAQHEEGRRQLLIALGWDLDKLTGYPVQRLADTASVIGEKAAELGRLATTPPTDLAAVEDRLRELGALFTAIRRLDALANAASVRLPQDVLDALGAIGQELVEFLILEYLSSYRPLAHDVARVLTLIDASEDYGANLTPPIGGGNGRPVYRLPAAPPRFRLDRLGEVLVDPVAMLRAEYLRAAELTTSDGARVVASRIYRRIAPLLVAIGAEVTDGTDVPGAAQRDPWRTLAIGFALSPKDPGAKVGALLQLLSDEEGGARLVVTPTGWTDHRVEGRWWAIEIAVSGQVGEFALGRTGVTLPSDATGLTLRTALERFPAANGEPTVIGVPAGTRLELGVVRVGGVLDLTTAEWDAQLEIELRACALAIGATEGDGFLASVLPRNGMRAPFDFGVTWSRSRGLRLKGSASLAVSIPVHVRLGSLNVHMIDLAIAGDNAAVSVTAAATVDVTLGPATASVQGLGIRGVLTFPPKGGNLGAAEGAIASKAPDGVGLSLNAAGVTGGGYLVADHDRGVYSGAVELAFRGVTITGVGLITTSPDEFSLVVLMAARGFPPVQLGFGFLLTGVGGLVAVNRTIAVDEVRAGLASGALDGLLFPTDVAATGPQIVADLQRYFPPRPGQYVIGPMVEVEWGERGVLRAALAVLIEFPAPMRVVLAGRARLTLPSEDAASVDVQLDVLGNADLGARELALDAVLRNSRVGPFTLTGRAVLRASWGSQPAFLLAVGGFHPRFAAPPGLPALRRLTIALGDGDNPRLRLECYLALTSNTAQFGARLDLAVAANIPLLGIFALRATIGFDALFQFDPFRFEVDVSIGVALTWNQRPFLVVYLDVTLSGPRPWHAVGAARFELFGSHTIRFEITVGDAAQVEGGGHTRLLDSLMEEFSRPSSWSSQLPDGETIVTLAEQAAKNADVLVHPLGALTMRQRLAPLDVRVDRIGADRVVDEQRTITIAEAGIGRLSAWTAVRDFFAPAEFQDLSDDEKLSRPSFEELTAGACLAGRAVVGPASWRSSTVQFETHELAADPLDGGLVEVDTRREALDQERVERQLAGAAVAIVEEQPYLGPALDVALVPATYAVVDDRTLSPARDDRGDLAFLSSYTDAEDRRRVVALRDGGLDGHVRRAPATALRVVETPEMFAQSHAPDPPLSAMR